MVQTGRSRVTTRDARLCKSFGENRVTDGVRTRDTWSHNPVLYQLSYGHREDDEGPFTDESSGTDSPDALSENSLPRRNTRRWPTPFLRAGAARRPPGRQGPAGARAPVRRASPSAALAMLSLEVSATRS